MIDEYLARAEAEFQRCRGSRSLLSPDDWKLLMTWKQACIPLRAVLRGIETTFDEWRSARKWPRRINALSFCTANVLKEAARMKEASVGKPGPLAD